MHFTANRAVFAVVRIKEVLFCIFFDLQILSLKYSVERCMYGEIFFRNSVIYVKQHPVSQKLGVTSALMKAAITNYDVT